MQIKPDWTMPKRKQIMSGPAKLLGLLLPIQIGNPMRSSRIIVTKGGKRIKEA
jgi:hypothetical protein